MSTAPMPTTGVIPEWTFADRLRKARQLHGGNQHDFAVELGAKPGTYAQWEAGNSTPRNLVALAKRIEVLTRVPAAWTLGLMDDGPNNDGTPATGDRGSAGLPRLDSNQQPSGSALNLITLPVIGRRALAAVA